MFVNISKVQWCLWGTCNLYCFIGCRQRQLLLQNCSWPIYGILFSNYIVQTVMFLSFWEGEAGAKPIVLQYHEHVRRLRIRTYLLSTTPCVLRLELIYAKYAGRGWGGPVGVWSDTAFIEGSPDWRPNILFSLFTVNCKITPRQSLPPLNVWHLSWRCLNAVMFFVVVISKLDFVLSPGNVVARLWMCLKCCKISRLSFAASILLTRWGPG